MCSRILVGLIILVAIVMGVMASIAGNLSDYWLSIVGVIARFFDVALPILAVGALLKYLCCCPGKSHCHTDDSKK